jgi:rod shape-determining protein MreD
VQVYVLDKLPPLHRFVIPILYYLFILWLPFSLNRFSLLLIAFVTGLMLDYFTQTPGLHAAACVLIAYVRPFIISILIPKDTAEFNYIFSICFHTNGSSSHLSYFTRVVTVWYFFRFYHQSFVHNRYQFAFDFYC